MIELLQATETQLALIVALAALAVTGRVVHRRRSLRPPPEDDSITPVRPRRRPRCSECKREDDGARGWFRSPPTFICPECLIKHYDG